MVIGNEEHKQRVNLSSFARSVLEGDRAIFGEGITLSGFLNRIIAVFSETADASIDAALQERRHQLREVLANSDDTAQKNVFIETMVDEYRRLLNGKKESYPQGDSVLFRLNNENFERLYEERIESSNYKTPSKYLKALFEEYARLSPAEREKVYFEPLINGILQPAIDAGYGLEIKLGAYEYAVRPYAVLADEFSTHLYLVGLSRPKDAPDVPEKIVSLRLSRLTKVKSRKHYKKLTLDNKRDIEQKIREVGVPYLIGEREEIVLRLTQAGEREFHGRSHMRPLASSIENGGIYRFFCTTRQIKNFFVSFGKEAEVLSPESLREEFLNHYKEAGQLYKDEI